VTGGTINTCQDTIKEYTGKEFRCTGSTVTGGQSATELAFERLNNGICEAVWGGLVPDATGYEFFPQPTVLVPVTFFRTIDAVAAAATEVPTVGPTQAPTVSSVPTKAPVTSSASSWSVGLAGLLFAGLGYYY
jgi:hypothetical protein